MGTRVQEKKKGEDDPKISTLMLATMFKSKIFLTSISFMIIVPQKMAANSEEATKQLEAMKNAIFPISKE